MKEGTIVRLKSGGPDMTISEGGKGRIAVVAIWFDDQKRYWPQLFRVECLEIVNKSNEPS